MDAILVDRGALRSAGDRGRVPGARRGIPVGGRRLAPGRHVRQGGRIQFLSWEEPGRLRRGGCGDDRRRAGRAHHQDAARARQAQKYYHDLEGYNGRLDAIQAAFLRVKLRHLDDVERAASRRRRSLQPSYLSSIPGVTVPFEPDHSKAVYHLYVIRNADRDALAEHLKRSGVVTGFHYPLPLHLQKCYRGWGYQRAACRSPNARPRDPVAADVSRADFIRAATRDRACWVVQPPRSDDDTTHAVIGLDG